MLEERLANPKLDSLSQRLSARCYLEALNRTETQEYIHWQINGAGGQGEEVFPEAACQSAFRATGGVPRLISQVCDHALLLVCVAGRRSVTPADIEEAWADLQQLPVPNTSGATTNTGSEAVIEFGSLADSEETTTQRRSDSTTSPAVFRVASLDQPGEPGESEPAGQIHRIERLLAEADEGFQPAGSIGPEVQLQFDRTNHPFQEAFEHEELVTDRYQAATAGYQAATAGRADNDTDAMPIQCCRDSRATTLDAADQRIRHTPCAEGLPHTACAGYVEPCPLTPAQQAEPCAAAPATPLTPDPWLPAADAWPLTPSQQAEPCATTPVGPPPGKPADYRRLFANLRRG
jgi:hypothetical protein